MTLNASRGSYDVNTPVEARKYLLPSVAERREQIMSEVKFLEARRDALLEQLGNPNRKNLKKHKGFEYDQKLYPPKLLKEYFGIGDRLLTLYNEMKEINSQFVEATDETFETMFIRAAKNMLLPDDFDRVHKYAERMMGDLMRDTHVGD